MENNIRYSIIIPIYNASKYLRECLDSVLIQEINNYEVILVNDGSTDDSLSICNEYALNDSRFIVIDKENEGPLMARHDGLVAANGEYLLFLDSDDYWEYNALTIIDANLKSNMFPDILCFNYKNVSENRKLIKNKSLGFPINKVINRKEYSNNVFIDLLTTGELGYLCFKVIKKEIFNIDYDYTQYSHIKMNEDMLMSILLFINSQNVLFIGDYLYNYRANPKSLMHSFSYEQIQNVYEVLSLKLALLSTQSDFNMDLENLFYTNLIFRYFRTIKTIAASNEKREKKRKTLEEFSKTKIVLNGIEKTKDKKLPGNNARIKRTLYLMNKKRYNIIINRYTFIFWVKSVFRKLKH